MLNNDVNLCVIREAQTKSLKLVDTEIAAYAVVAQCSGSLQEFKSYMADHVPGSPPQFEIWWQTEEVYVPSIFSKRPSHLRGHSR